MNNNLVVVLCIYVYKTFFIFFILNFNAYEQNDIHPYILSGEYEVYDVTTNNILLFTTFWQLLSL